MHAMGGDTRFDSSMAVKLDMAKEWPFLSEIMVKLPFRSDWVDLIMHCVKLASFSFIINGSPSGHLIPNRGIRQGDPISSYLFLFCSEGLSSLIRKSVERASLHGYKTCARASAVLISYLQTICSFFVEPIQPKPMCSSKSYISTNKPLGRWLTLLKLMWCLVKGFSWTQKSDHTPTRHQGSSFAWQIFGSSDICGTFLKEGFFVPDWPYKKAHVGLDEETNLMGRQGSADKGHSPSHPYQHYVCFQTLKWSMSIHSVIDHPLLLGTQWREAKDTLD